MDQPVPDESSFLIESFSENDPISGGSGDTGGSHGGETSGTGDSLGGGTSGACESQGAGTSFPGGIHGSGRSVPGGIHGSGTSDPGESQGDGTSDPDDDYCDEDGAEYIAYLLRGEELPHVPLSFLMEMPEGGNFS